MPTVIREFARASAGEVGAIAAGVFSSGELLTAVRNGSDNLELIHWHPDAANRALTREKDWDSGTQAGEVGEIALAMMGLRCVTAVQNANGYLLLIPWELNSDGTLSRLEYASSSGWKGHLPHNRTAERNSGRYCCPERLRELAAHSLVRRCDDGACFAAQQRHSTRWVRHFVGHLAFPFPPTRRTTDCQRCD